jgi:hypothetical protein
MKQYNIFGDIDHIEIINNTFKTKKNMINGFKIETKELTEKEFSIVPDMIELLINRIGKEKAIKNKDIIFQMQLRGFRSITPVRVRKLIHYIRVNKLVENLVATSSGYHIAQDREELESFVKSLQQRINSIDEVRKSFI